MRGLRFTLLALLATAALPVASASCPYDPADCRAKVIALLGDTASVTAEAHVALDASISPGGAIAFPVTASVSGNVYVYVSFSSNVTNDSVSATVNVSPSIGFPVQYTGATTQDLQLSSATPTKTLLFPFTLGSSLPAGNTTFLPFTLTTGGQSQTGHLVLTSPTNVAPTWTGPLLWGFLGAAIGSFATMSWKKLFRKP